MKKLCYIVGAGDMSETDLTIPADALVIAADGGLVTLEAVGIVPDIVLGDFDSLGRVPEGKNVLFHEPEKDDTDTMLAVRRALELGAETIVILGGLGGRFDHSLANLQTLSYIANHGVTGWLIGCGSVCTVIKNSGISFKAEMTGILSVFSLTESSRGVELRGVKYPLYDHVLTSAFPLGVSNEFTGIQASVSVREGALAVMWQGGSYQPELYSLFEQFEEET